MLCSLTYNLIGLHLAWLDNLRLVYQDSQDEIRLNLYNRKGGFMDKNRLTKDWLKENSGKIKKIYSFAVANSIDINSKEAVLDLLRKFDSENANEEYAQTFSKMLQLFDRIAKKKVIRRSQVN